MKFKSVLLTACLATAGSANAATIWLPDQTNGSYEDVDEIAFALDSAGGSIAFFNYDQPSNTILLGQRLVVDLGNGTGTVDFNDNNNIITSGANSLDLGTDGKFFAVGASLDNGATWTLDDGNPFGADSIWILSFQTPSGTQSTVQVDASPVELSTPPLAVPLPAAVWLFGAGLIGLVGIARRSNGVGNRG